ncbi:hypothetical protein JCM16814_31880 [Desulfobaculum senezii]
MRDASGQEGRCAFGTWMFLIRKARAGGRLMTETDSASVQGLSLPRGGSGVVW